MTPCSCVVPRLSLTRSQVPAIATGEGCVAGYAWAYAVDCHRCGQGAISSQSYEHALAVLRNGPSVSLRPDDEERERLAFITQYYEKRIVAAITEWAGDLAATREDYIDSLTTGRHNGRRINKELAKRFAHEFGERAEAVDGCVPIIKAVFAELAPKAKAGATHVQG